MFIKRPTALVVKLYLPVMSQVTSVSFPFGRNVNSTGLSHAKGLTNCNRIRIISHGLLSVIVVFPAPTWLFPDHWYSAPTPSGGPAYVFLIFGSYLSQGDHFGQCRKSFTSGKIADGSAAIDIERVTRNGPGRLEMNTANRPIMTTSPIKTLMIMGVAFEEHPNSNRVEPLHILLLRYIYHPRHAEFIIQHAESLREEGFSKRHLDIAAFA
jgi:hypothetical protein